MDRARFLMFSEADRLGHIAAEISRYRSSLARGQAGFALGACERARELIDHALAGASDASSRDLLERLRKALSHSPLTAAQAEGFEQELLARKLSEIV